MNEKKLETQMSALKALASLFRNLGRPSRNGRVNYPCESTVHVCRPRDVPAREEAASAPAGTYQRAAAHRHAGGVCLRGAAAPQRVSPLQALAIAACRWLPRVLPQKGKYQPGK